MSGAEWIEAVWLTEDDEGGVGVWRDPGNARKWIVRDRAAEVPGVYEWVNDPDRTHELLLRDDEPTGLTLRMMLVADAESGAGPVTAEQQQDGAVGRLTAMLARLDKFGTDFPYRCEGSRVILGEILSVSVDCENGHSEPVGAGNATGEDLRAVLAERTALAAQVAELTADVRAVAEACSDFGNDEGPRGIRQLYARFAGRIAALDAAETEEA